MKYIFLDFPLESIHKKAMKAHEAANCAGEQDKYWEMHDLLFANPKKLDPPDLSQHAGTLGLDLPRFEECLNSNKYEKEIRADMAEGRKAGTRGTPTSLVGYIVEDGKKVRAVKRIRGARPYDGFKEDIDSLLAPEEKKKEE